MEIQDWNQEIREQGRLLQGAKEDRRFINVSGNRWKNTLTRLRDDGLFFKGEEIM
jgi:hypothetical protein